MNKSQVAARLGASVVLTDQSKILPTLIKNARANAKDLECRRRPPSPDSYAYHDSTPPFADDMDYPEDVSKLSSKVKNSARTTASMSTVSPTTASSLTSSCGRHDDAAFKKLAIRHQCGGGYRCGDGTNIRRPPKEVEETPSPRCDAVNSTTSGVRCCSRDGTTSTKGGWRVAELLFSSSEEELRRWRGVPLENMDGRKHYSHGEDLFDLVVAADVVYLTDLWDSMACTFKVRIFTACVSNPYDRGYRRNTIGSLGVVVGFLGGSTDNP